MSPTKVARKTQKQTNRTANGVEVSNLLMDISDGTPPETDQETSQEPQGVPHCLHQTLPMSQSKMWRVNVHVGRGSMVM